MQHALARVVALLLLLNTTMAMTAQRVLGLKQALTSVSPELIRAAATRIAPHAARTAVLRSDAVDARAGCAVHVKAEHLQLTGSFKYRGALNAVLSLTEAEAARGVVAHSTGNHGAAVARAAKARRAPCCIVVPSTTPAAKLANIARYCDDVVQCEPTPRARAEAAEAAAERLGGAAVVHPFDDARVICGQGTIGLELLEDLPALDAILVPVSGGGMLAGIAMACAGTATKVVAVEPAGKRLGDALAAGERCLFSAAELQAAPTLKTVADAMPTRLLGETLSWPLVFGLVEDVLTVNDAAILEAVRVTAVELKQAVEPAGAVALAAALSPEFAAMRDREGWTNVAVVACGGNVDLEVLSRALSG